MFRKLFIISSLVLIGCGDASYQLNDDVDVLEQNCDGSQKFNTRKVNWNQLNDKDGCHYVSEKSRYFEICDGSKWVTAYRHDSQNNYNIECYVVDGEVGIFGSGINKNDFVAACSSDNAIININPNEQECQLDSNFEKCIQGSWNKLSCSVNNLTCSKGFCYGP